MRKPSTYSVDNCPSCGGPSRVLDNRGTHVGGIPSRRRHRVCAACGERRTTVEISETQLEALLSVREDFRRVRQLVLGGISQTK
ncbi:NrdR family transcriptional regulator [Xanthobacter flavus]